MNTQICLDRVEALIRADKHVWQPEEIEGTIRNDEIKSESDAMRHTMGEINDALDIIDDQLAGNLSQSQRVFLQICRNHLARSLVTISLREDFDDSEFHSLIGDYFSKSTQAK